MFDDDDVRSPPKRSYVAGKPSDRWIVYGLLKIIRWNVFFICFTELKKPISEKEFQRQLKDENAKGLKFANKRGDFKYHVGCEHPSQIKNSWIYAVDLPINKNQPSLYKVVI